MTTKNSVEVRAFFDQFEQPSAEQDTDITVALFAEVFMNADPNGVAAVPREALRAALPQRQKMFDAIGARAVGLTKISETVLDDNYVLVDTEWAAELDRPFGRRETLPLSSSFILRREGPTFAIVFYLNHQDIAEVARRLSSSNIQ